MLRRLIAFSLPLVPKAIVRRVASRYVAGETPREALERTARLNDLGCRVTLALLGEEVLEREPADAATEEYVGLLEEIDRQDLDANISVKLTLLGLRIEEELCRANLERLVVAASQRSNFVRIDMEDHTLTTKTLEIFGDASTQHNQTGSHVGIVLQAYLRRTSNDIVALPTAVNVRLCKGIYVEPAEVAIQDYQRVRDNFVALLEQLFRAGHFVGIATHDDYLIDAALDVIERLEVPREGYEFQMLLGVTEKRRDQLVAAGHGLRVYVPYGVDWYAYSVRRLRENPQIALYVLKAMFRQ